MSSDLIRAHKPDKRINHPKVSVPACQKNISHSREIRHAPYKCTKSYTISNKEGLFGYPPTTEKETKNEQD